jgi:hypothetical protein
MPSFRRVYKDQSDIPSFVNSQMIRQVHTVEADTNKENENNLNSVLIYILTSLGL